MQCSQINYFFQWLSLTTKKREKLYINEEIKKIDKSNMTRLEKKALRKEVKSIKAKLQTTSRGVYLSVGAIIIIILLLILLL